MSRSDADIDALVLAGVRASGDPLCASERVDSKARIEIAGIPMLARVLGALSQAGLSRPVWVLGSDGHDLAPVTGNVEIAQIPATGHGPAASLAAALRGGVKTPLLVTTADHALLSAEIVTEFLNQARQTGADICIGFARRPTIEAAFPETRRTYLPIGARDLSGCNLFYLANGKAVPILEFWGGIERHRKRPWTLASRMGLIFLFRLLLRRSDEAAVFQLLSQRFGATIKPVILPFAEAAVDVDTISDLQLVRSILEGRASRDLPSTTPE